MAALLLCKTAADVQTQTRPRNVPRPAGPEVRGEQAVALVGRDAHAVILDADYRQAAGDRHRDDDRHVGWAVFERVVKQVVEDLRDAAGVRAHTRSHVGTIEP